jgi:predicted nuclease of restriction endonuclease-like (RecB) superfamily
MAFKPKTNALLPQMAFKDTRRIFERAGIFEGGFMKKTLSGDKTVMKRYGDLLTDIKTRIQQAQNRAVMSANAEMIRLYWDIGQMVAKRQGLEGWGKGLLRRLATDLKDEIPEIKGFSERNLQLMIQFQKEYPGLFAIPQRPVAELPETEFVPKDSAQPAQGAGETQIVQRVVAQLPWTHNVILIQKLKDLPTRIWYARQAMAQGWSTDQYGCSQLAWTCP